jgi:hypothetical protein
MTNDSRPLAARIAQPARVLTTDDWQTESDARHRAELDAATERRRTQETSR